MLEIQPMPGAGRMHEKQRNLSRVPAVYVVRRLEFPGIRKPLFKPLQVMLEIIKHHHTFSCIAVYDFRQRFGGCIRHPMRRMLKILFIITAPAPIALYRTVGT